MADAIARRDGGAGADLSPDGQRVLLARLVPPPPPPTEIRLIINWIEEVKQRLAAGK